MIDIVNWIIGFFSFAFTDIASPECTNNANSEELDVVRYFELWWVNATLPLLLMLPFVVKLRSCDRHPKFNKDKTIQTLAIIANITYMYAISTALEPWDCREAAPGIFRNDHDPEMGCFSTPLQLYLHSMDIHDYIRKPFVCVLLFRSE